MSRKATPNVDDVISLPTLAHSRVSADMIDDNGHMNVRAYYDHAVRAADAMLHSVGIDDRYRANSRLGAFGVEHHITFRSEMHVHDDFSMRGLWLEHSGRTAHLIVFMVDDSTRALSCLVEMIVLNVGLDSRRATAFSDAVAASIAKAVAQKHDLAWARELPTVMSLER